MCCYNAVNGDYACENKYLLTDVLKKDWKFKGFVLSDWGGTHSTVKASAAGLDNEEPEDLFYGAKLKEAVQSGQSSDVRDRRSCASRICAASSQPGLWISPYRRAWSMWKAVWRRRERIEESSIVLLKNEQNVLPLDRGEGTFDRGDRLERRHRNDLGRRFRAGGSSGPSVALPGKVMSGFRHRR